MNNKWSNKYTILELNHISSNVNLYIKSLKKFLSIDIDNYIEKGAAFGELYRTFQGLNHEDIYAIDFILRNNFQSKNDLPIYKIFCSFSFLDNLNSWDINNIDD